MLFYSNEPNLVVISKKTKKPIAQFKDGKLNTNDPVLIEKLKLYFKYRKNAIADLNLLRKEAKRKGIKLHRGAKEADIIKALKEVKNNEKS